MTPGVGFPTFRAGATRPNGALEGRFARARAEGLSAKRRAIRRARPLLGSRVDVAGLGGASFLDLAACVDACFDCAQACTLCADASESTPNGTGLRRCARLSEDCAILCAATGRVLSRSRDGISRALLDGLVGLCARACEECARACGDHADASEHCALCAASCERCRAACRGMLRDDVRS
jgi:hypothetical protein